MNILYIAYSCDPFNGSEDQIGWNIPFINSQDSENKIWVITKQEQKKNIDRYLKENKIIRSNLQFYYVDIPKSYKRFFLGFLYSGRLNIWHRRALKIAKGICRCNKIDIIHQLTPIEFRAIGKYYKIQNTKYIVGPIGGGISTPKSLKSYAKSKIGIEVIREILNRLYSKKNKLLKIEKKCDYILYSNYETSSFFENNKKDVYTEIGISKENIIERKSIENKTTDKTVFLVIGRLIYWKGHEFLLDAIEKIPEKYEYKVKIIGDGSEKKSIEQIIKNSDNLKKHVELCGQVQYKEMKNEYDTGNVLVLPSIRENTGTVILEALSRGIPVIAYNGFGAKVILDEKCGYLYYGKNKEEVIHDLSKKMIECIENQNILKMKSINAIEKARQNTWEVKCKKYNKIYNELLNYEEK